MKKYKCPECGSKDLIIGPQNDFFEDGIEKHRDSFMCHNCCAQFSFINGELEECYSMEEMEHWFDD